MYYNLKVVFNVVTLIILGPYIQSHKAPAPEDDRNDTECNASWKDRANLATLRHVQILFRHGERTAINPLVSDSDPKIIQEMHQDGVQGFGQLTNNGKKEMFQLGEYFRARYQGFIDEAYNSKEVYILSSDSERTLKSAGACMLGFYKTFHESAPWNIEFPKTVEPIPIRTLPSKNDRMLKNSEVCPNKDEWFEDFFTQAPFWKHLLSNESEMLNYIRRHSADPVLNDPHKSAYAKFYAFIAMSDNLMIKKLRNETRPTLIPEWALPLYDNPLFTNCKGLMQLDEVRPAAQKRLVSGPLLQYLRNNFDAKLKDDTAESSNSRKMIFLSGHDRNMASLLSSLGMFEPNEKVGMPTFASSFMIELHRSHSEQYYVEFWYRNDTSRDPYFLRVPQCAEPCAYDYFRDHIIDPVIPTIWEFECHDKSLSSKAFPASVRVAKTTASASSLSKSLKIPSPQHWTILLTSFLVIYYFTSTRFST